MPVRGPSLVELHAFLAVARSGSFRKAADELCVTQAAVSRAVQRLEAEIGRDLFMRTAAGVSLTPAGHQLRKLVGKPVVQIAAAAEQMRRKPERLRLRLSVITSLGTLWLMPRLEDFRKRHPEVDLEFRQYHHDENFTRDDVDLWIENRLTTTSQWPRQIAARYLVGKDIIAVCAPRVGKRLRSAADLLAQRRLYHSNYPGNWALWAAAAGVSLPASPGETGFDLVLNMIEAVRNGMGVAVVQRCMVEGDLAAGRLMMPVDVAASTGRGYYLCRRRAVWAHPAADLFATWVLEQAQSRALPRQVATRHD